MTSSTAHKGVMLLLVTVLSCASQLAHAQWTSTEGPYGGEVLSMAVFDGNLYASGADGGIFRSSDEGQIWSNALPDGFGRYSLVSTNDYLFAVGEDLRRYDGSQWDMFPSPISGIDFSDMISISNLTAIDSTLFLEIFFDDANWLYSSTTNGVEWHVVSLLPGTGLTAVGSDLYVSGSGGGIWRSMDKGYSWPEVLPVDSQSSSYLNYKIIRVDGVLYAARYLSSMGGGGVFQSTDNGMNWDYASAGMPTGDNVVHDLIAFNSNLYISLDSGVYRLPAGTSTWIPSGTGLGSSIVSSHATEGTQLLVGTDHGVYRIMTNGTIWEEQNVGLSIPICENLIWTGSDIYIGSSSVYRKLGGSSWQTAGLKWVFSLAYKDGAVFAGTSYGAVMQSYDQGLTWESANIPAGSWWFRSVTSLVSNGNYLFASFSDSTIYRTADLGITWDLAAQGLDFRTTSMAASDSELYALSSQGIYLSSNQGSTWALAANNGWPDSTYSVKLTTSGTDIYATTSNGAFHSDDQGASWSSINTGALDTLNIHCLAANGPNLFAGTVGQGVFYSTDHGSTWTSMNWGIPESAAVLSLAATSNELYAGIYQEGVWKTNLTNMGVPEGTKDRATFSLTPNPTTGLATLELTSISDPRTVNLFDATGRKLMNQAVGISETKLLLDLRSKQNGIYFVEVISTDGNRQVQKLVKH